MPSGAEQEGEAGGWWNLKRDVLLLGRLLAPELGASATTSAGPGMDAVTQTQGGGGAAATPCGQAGREARPGSQAGVNTRTSLSREPGRTVGQQSAKACEVLRARKPRWRQRARCKESSPSAPVRAWIRGRQISLPRAILSSPHPAPRGISASQSLLEPSTHTGQAAKCPFHRVSDQPRPFQSL